MLPVFHFDGGELTMPDPPLSELTDDELLDNIERIAAGSPVAELVHLVRYCRKINAENVSLRARIKELEG